nr:hypothetical protein [Planctomycetota bacterium]
MNNSYLSLCDDFYVDMYVNTELELPKSPDTILTFFERVSKQFPSMVNFQKRNKNEYMLEEDRGGGSYRWVSLEKDRFGAGMVNCGDLDDVFELQRLVLELAPYMLSVSSLDVDSLDLAFAMDFDHKGNHDEVIAGSFTSKTPFASFSANGYKPIDFSPSIVVALSEDTHL